VRLDVLQVLPQARRLVLNLLLHTRRVAEAPHELGTQEERRKRRVRGGELVAERELAREQLVECLRALDDAGLQLRITVEDAIVLADELVRDGVDEKARLRTLHRVLGQQTRLREEVGHELDEDSARSCQERKGCEDGRAYSDSVSFALSGEGCSGETSGPPYVIAGTLPVAGLTYRAVHVRIARVGR
jgi:hypothetical protein